MNGDPKALAAKWIEGVEAIIERYPPGPEDLPEDPHESARLFNNELARGLAIHELNERFGFGPTVADFKAEIIQVLQALPKRKLSWGENLCIATAAMYRASFGFETAAAKDAPMLEAIVAAEVTLRGAKAWESAGEEGDLAEFIKAAYSESNRDPDTPRKAIQRFRGRIQGKFLFHFNAEAFRMEVVPHDQIVDGTSRSPGRPRKKI